MKIALIQPNVNAKKSITMANYSEPGMGYIGAVAKNRGHEVLQVQQIAQSDREIIESILYYKPDILGMSVITSTISKAHRLLGGILGTLQKKPFVVFGNTGATTEYKRIFEYSLADCVIAGEGEITFGELLRSFENDDDWHDIIGIVLPYSETAKRTKRITDLDSLPMINRDGFPIASEYYRRMAPIEPAPTQQRKASVYGSRGCPYNCSFCLNEVEWGRQWVGRSIDSIVSEIDFLRGKYDINLIGIEDMESTFDEERVKFLIKGMEKFNGEVKFYLQGRVSDVQDRDTLFLLKEAGCTEIELGVESGSQKRLDSYDKKINIQQIEHAFRIAKDAGLTTHALVMLGGLGETYKTIEQTEDLLNRITPDRIRVSFQTPFIGTRIRQQIEQYPQYKMISENDADYLWTTDFPVVTTDTISHRDYLRLRHAILKKYYTSTSYKRHAAERITRFPELSQSYEEFFEFLKINLII